MIHVKFPYDCRVIVDARSANSGESDGEEVVDNRQGFAGPAVSNGLTNDSEDARRALTTLVSVYTLSALVYRSSLSVGKCTQSSVV